MTLPLAYLNQEIASIERLVKGRCQNASVPLWMVRKYQDLVKEREKVCCCKEPKQ